MEEKLPANYADDSNLSVIRDEVQEVKTILETETVKVLTLFDENHIKANPDKFQCNLHSKTLYPEFCISLGEYSHRSIRETVILLEIVIDDKLTYSQHVRRSQIVQL